MTPKNRKQRNANKKAARKGGLKKGETDLFKLLRLAVDGRNLGHKLRLRARRELLRLPGAIPTQIARGDGQFAPPRPVFLAGLDCEVGAWGEK